MGPGGGARAGVYACEPAHCLPLQAWLPWEQRLPGSSRWEQCPTVHHPHIMHSALEQNLCHPHLVNAALAPGGMANADGMHMIIEHSCDDQHSRSFRRMPSLHTCEQAAMQVSRLMGIPTCANAMRKTHMHVHTHSPQLRVPIPLVGMTPLLACQNNITSS